MISLPPSRPWFKVNGHVSSGTCPVQIRLILEAKKVSIHAVFLEAGERPGEVCWLIVLRDQATAARANAAVASTTGRPTKLSLSTKGISVQARTSTCAPRCINACAAV
jgi:hypothetical protein